ncbi:amidase [Bosea sp. PAMC 26642]|uniref:amidase n=1 Tax=Bosea sp. (strain PAMC 26642) TaxID=1792307 RepID=UPI00076FFFDC|nr:amidase [Bosea sp. PAMC 26642]AMJ62847.1 glutamyl-tRNA amidotransferase [Bosea sp. PAMC 26642]
MNAQAKSSLLHLSLTDAADALKDGAVTAVELTTAALEAFTRVDEVINSAIWLEGAAALEAAETLDKKRKSGATLGPLHGLPLAHKDMYYKAGKLSTCGSAIRKDFRPSYTATVMERLEDAGSVTLGGLNMAEFAQNPTGHNQHYGHCRNPWHPDYCTGGSSSGSGAAVAARLIYGALGSDTGGSIRLPAAICGVTGIKATQTRVSRHGVMPLSFSADNVGPLTQTARDAARFLGVIAGHDPKDATSASEPVPDYEAALTGDIRGMRIGVPTNYFFDGIDPEVQAAFDAVVAVLQARGAVIAPVTIPHMDAVATYGGIVSRVEGGTIHAQWMRQRPQDYAVHLSGRLYPSQGIPGTYYLEALARRGAILKAVAATVFGVCDAFITPTLRMKVPTLLATDIDAGTPGAIETFQDVSINTRPINYLGLPSVSVPCGLDSNGLPIGFQIQGRPFAEARVLKIADAYQRDTDWHRRLPPNVS